MTDILRYVFIVIFIILSAVFSASETAFLSANENKLRREGDKAAAAAMLFRGRFDSTGLITILIGNNLVNVAASTVATAIAIQLMGDKGAWIATAIMTIVIITFGEVIPKILAAQKPEEVAVWFAPALNGLHFILFPLSRGINWGIEKMSRIWEKGESDETITEDDLETILDTVEDEGVVDEDVTELLQSAFNFDDVLAYEVITPRVDMVSIDIEDDREENLKIAFASPYTRIPVYKDTPDHIIGILHMNNLYKALVKDPNADLQRLMMRPQFVHKTTPLPDVLNTMRRTKNHMVVVTDEYGGTMGILTMEDVLEQLVGDIWDETDIIEEEFVQVSENVYEVDGSMRLDDFMDEFDKEADDIDDDNATVGGWTVEMLNGYPKLKESFVFENLTVTILKKQKMRVLRVRVDVDPDWHDEEDDEVS